MVFDWTDRCPGRWFASSVSRGPAPQAGMCLLRSAAVTAARGAAQAPPGPAARMSAAPSAAWQAVSGRRGKLADGFARLIGKMQAAQSAAGHDLEDV